MKALDLCCGRGGWAAGLIAAGWEVVGVDIEARFRADYPGQFVCADLLTWEGWRSIPHVRLVVASTPCDEFSRWSMPWTRAQSPAVPSLALWNRANYIARELGVPIVQENVRGAQQFCGRSVLNCGPFHLWYDVPALAPYFDGVPKSRLTGENKAKRAVIPFALAAWIGRCHANNFGTGSVRREADGLRDCAPASRTDNPKRFPCASGSNFGG